MSTDERKTILVLVDIVDRHLPSIRVVAQFALGAILAAMEICMAILAFLSDVAEIKISMAIEALHHRVASSKRELGLGMSEFDFRPDWFPALRAVTLLAGNLQFVPVRTAGKSARLDLLTK